MKKVIKYLYNSFYKINYINKKEGYYNMNLTIQQYNQIWTNILSQYTTWMCSNDTSITHININECYNLFNKENNQLYIYALKRNPNQLVDIDLFTIKITSVTDYINNSVHNLTKLDIDNIQLIPIPYDSNDNSRINMLKYIDKIKQKYNQLQMQMNNIFVDTTHKKSAARSQALKKSWEDPTARANRVANNAQRKEVKCITTNEIFPSAAAAAEKYHVSYQTVQRACNKLIKGFKDPSTQQLLEWEYTQGKRKEYQEKTKAYAIYDLYYKNQIVLVICSSLPKENILPYQKCNKAAPAYKMIQEKGYQHFRLEVVASGILDKTAANEQKLKHINQLCKQGHVLYNKIM